MQSFPSSFLSQLAPLASFPNLSFKNAFHRFPPGKTPLPSRNWLLVGLFLFCLVPRLAMAWKLEAVCDDAFYYFAIADCLKHGNLDVTFEHLSLNIFPPILLAIHELGIDWIDGGKLWSVLVSSLVVLPLFGWVRRLFDDRVAFGTCFLYCVHAELIELGVEPIRDPTFWLLFSLCLYCTLRAALEVRVWWYLLAGFALALALHARFEAWFLVVAIIGWTGLRWISLSRTGQNQRRERSNDEHANLQQSVESDFARIRLQRQNRRRLIAGLCACCAVTPCLVVAVNLAFLRDYDQWEWGRMNHFQTAWTWLANLGEAANPAPVGAHHSPVIHATTQTASSVDAIQTASPTFATLVAGYLEDLSSQLDPTIVGLLLFGFLFWRRELFQSDKSVAVVIGLLLMVAVWIVLRRTGGMNARYFVVLFFVSLPWASLAFLALLSRIAEFSIRLTNADRKTSTVLAGTLLLVTAICWTDAVTSRHRKRHADQQLGHWLHEQLGTVKSVVTDIGSARVGYAVQSGLPHVAFNPRMILPVFDNDPPELIILSNKESFLLTQPEMVTNANRLGLRRLDDSELPESARGKVILARSPNHDLPKLASSSASSGHR